MFQFNLLKSQARPIDVLRALTLDTAGIIFDPEISSTADFSPGEKRSCHGIVMCQPSILYRDFFDVVDHKKIHRGALRLETQAEVVLNCGEDGRSGVRILRGLAIKTKS